MAMCGSVLKKMYLSLLVTLYNNVVLTNVLYLQSWTNSEQNIYFIFVNVHCYSVLTHSSLTVEKHESEFNIALVQELWLINK